MPSALAALVSLALVGAVYLAMTGWTAEAGISLPENTRPMILLPTPRM